MPRQADRRQTEEEEYQNEGWRTSLLPLDCFKHTYLLSPFHTFVRIMSYRDEDPTLAREGNERRRGPHSLLLQVVSSVQCRRRRLPGFI